MSLSPRASRTRSLPSLLAITLGVIVMPLTGVYASAPGRQLSLDERVAAQQAIDRVYYAHQVGATRPFEEVVPRSAIEEKVRTYLKQTVALEQVWATPVTAASLEAELERMVRQTRSPERLQELFAALHNDSFLIQECLVRPALVARLTHGFYANDAVIHGAARALADEIHADLNAETLLVSDPHPFRSVMSFHRKSANDHLVSDGEDPLMSESGAIEAGRIDLTPDEFTRFRATLPGSVGVPGPLTEDDTGVGFSAILEEDANDIQVARWAAPKRTWDEWWTTAQESFNENSVAAVASPSSLLPETPTRGAATRCLPDDTWDNSGRFDDYLEPRYMHTAVWTGSFMIVWGGLSLDGISGTGSRYDPATDTWTTVATFNAPEPRNLHTATWTGTEMVVWGGGDNLGGLFGNGARYNPALDTWSPMQPGISARAGHTAIWTGTEMIIWGGYNYQGGGPEPGARYDPVSNTWRAMSTLNSPGPRYYHTAVWTGTEMIVWGGTISFPTPVNTGARYDPSTDRWTATPSSGAPSARMWHISVWTGRYMIVLTGYASGADAGGLFDPALNTWSTMSDIKAVGDQRGHTAIWDGFNMIVWAQGILGAYHPTGNYWTQSSAPNKPASFQHHTAIWTGTQMIVWGGQDANHTILSSGGRYTPSTNTWTSMSDGTYGPRARYGHAAVWTGTQMIIWSGQVDHWYVTGDGWRYDPALDAWLPITSTGNPGARSYPTTIWTGHYMLVWGGAGPLASGGRYDPIRDEWLPVSTTNAPFRRNGYSVVWTGSEMVLQGGNLNNSTIRTGGIYDPEADTWRSTSLVGAPYGGIGGQSAIWTGTEMLIYGGDLGDGTYFSYGSRYNPVTDTWRNIVGPSNVPYGRAYHSTAWTGHEMIVWGGRVGTGFIGYYDYSNTGNRYDPQTDSWTSISSVNSPTPRIYASTTWTGKEMVTWGGFANGYLVGSGGRYDPDSDQWTPMTQVLAPKPRYGHSALWTGSFVAIWGGIGGSQAVTNGGLYALGHTTDDDGDGLSECDGDCNDDQRYIYPGAPQSCDGINTDCNSPYWPLTPANETDEDRDGIRICQGDCDDTRADVRPTATEICNLIDDDCDALTDEDPQGLDADHDLVQDMCDNCRLAANPGQEDMVHPNGIGDACDDPDADSVADSTDNCIDIPNTSQTDADQDGYGNACDVCPDIYNPAQAEDIACIAVGSSTRQCLPAVISKDESAVTGKITVSAYRLLTPTSITFEIYVSSCNQIDQMEFFLNGGSLGTFHDSYQTCSCTPPVQSFVVSDATLLESLWNPMGNNVLRVTKTGSLSDYGSFVTWARARIVTPGSVITECMYDPTQTDCENLDACRARYDEYVDHSMTLAEPFLIDEGRIVTSFTDGRLPDQIDISSLPPGQARLCVETKEAGTLYGSSIYQELFRLDPVTGAASPPTQLSFYSQEIEYDNLGRRAFSVPGSYPGALLEFDIQSGVQGGQPGPNDYRQYTALEFVETRLYATTIDNSSNSVLRILSPATGESKKVGVTGRGPITGLAWEENRGVMYAAESGGSGRNLLTIDLKTGLATIVAPLSVNVDGLEFGADGFLYGGGNSLYLPPRILRIDPATGATIEITISNLPSYTLFGSLTLAAPILRDCVEFVKGTQASLLINRGCNALPNAPPSAVAGSDLRTECASPAGALVRLDGSASSDPDSTPGTLDDIALFEWLEDLGLPSQKPLGTGQVIDANLSLGAHQVSLKVTDSAGATDVDTKVATVVDTTPPTLSVALSPATLWPPNHRMVEVSAAVSASDLCGDTALELMDASSSEPDDAEGIGDGNTGIDVQGATVGEADLKVDFRAERSAFGPGRFYTMTYRVSDASGNAIDKSAIAVVPHDKAGVVEPLEIALDETSTGTVMEWHPVPGAVFYNVIRGSVSAIGDAASAIDLGNVTCVVGASQDSNTAGHADSDQPPAGEAFFYLVEYNDGWRSSYGEPTALKPRVTRSGACE